MAEFRIAHMYPDLMNLYGDRGNLVCLQQRLAWYGHKCKIQNISLGDKLEFDKIDMIFMGGGSDREQGLVYRDLLGKADNLLMKINSGLPVLCICGAYQLLGKSYRSWEGSDMAGLGFFDFFTAGRKSRLIGNILINTNISGKAETVVGFENHGGRTYFNDSRLQPFGTVVKGYGNNGEDKTEGLVFKNLLGTYLHGPLLPKNPAIADWYIRNMAARKGVKITRVIDDKIENFAHQQVKQKILNN
ncbi:MAG: type 1 glutamine amidotransferase [Syntrophomonadaceae bacterium]|jgi:CobQ-like glutamine amidotransferase family enzyme